MSGALGSIGSIASVAGGSIGSALQGLLHAAAWRGITFDMLNSRHTAGRRWAQFLFPGRPDTVQEDLGAVDGPIEVNGLLIGDDWLRRQKRFEAASKHEGPGTLIHPWLGELKCTMLSPAEFSFDHQQDRVCTVTLHFQVWQQRKPAQPTSLGGLLDTIDGAIDAAQLFLAGVLAPLGDALGLLGLAQSVLGRVGGVYDGLLGSSPSGIGSDSTGALAAAAASPLDAMTGGVALVAGATLGAQLAGLLAATPAALSLAADSAADPAIGPGPLEPAPAPEADPRVAATVLLAALPLLQPVPGDLPVAVALLQVARVQAVAEAARAASGATWDSRNEAVEYRRRVELGLAGVQAELAVAGAGAAWRALRDVRSAWARDLNEVIGRLPPVQYVVTRSTLSAWQLALAAAGDTPSNIRPTMLDIVRRNRIRHPGAVAAGRYEIVGAGLRTVSADPPVVADISPNADRPDAISIGGAVISVGGEAIRGSSGVGRVAQLLTIGGAIITIGGEPIVAG